MSKSGFILYILFYSVNILAQYPSIDMKLDLSMLQMYMKQNEKFILNDYNQDELRNRLEGNLFLSSGEFGKTQFEMDLRFNSSFSNSKKHEVLIRQLYLETPLTEFSFLTVGKKRKNFGASSVYSFSNRISPLEIFIDRSERVIPGLIEYDYIFSSTVSFESLIYFNDGTKNLRDVNLSLGFEYSQDRFFTDIHLYYESMNRLMLGGNVYYNFDELGLFTEFILKDGSDQRKLVNNSFLTEKGFRYCASWGVKWQKSVYSVSLEYARRDEGYSETEAVRYINYTRETNELKFYEQNYFGKDYFYFSSSANNFFDANTSVFISAISTADLKSRYITAGINYMHNDSVNFGLYTRYHSGGDNSEYIIFSPSKYYLYLTVSASF